MRFVGMVQAKKFGQSFVNESLAWNLHDRDVERRGKQDGRRRTRRPQGGCF